MLTEIDKVYGVQKAYIFRKINDKITSDASEQFIWHLKVINSLDTI